MSTIMIAAAGTGGHVFPALAVAEMLRQRGHTIVWLGTTEQRIEARVVPTAGFTLEQIAMQGLRGHGWQRKLLLPWRMLKAIAQCRRLYRQHHADLVVSFGGYVCGPAGLAARSAGIPLLVHEQNAVAGMTNKLLARFAQQVMLGFADAQAQLPNGEVTGNPLRAEWAAPSEREPHDGLRVLVVGGSLGAQALNTAVPQALAQLSQREQLDVLHQCGVGVSAGVERDYAQHGLKNVRVTEFIEQMHAAYQWADVVICRAGALTVSELAVVGTPAIFVPLPHAVDDHQTANANALAKVGAGVVLAQPKLLEITPLAEILEQWLATPAELEHMRTQAHKAACPNATQAVVERCEQWI